MWTSIISSVLDIVSKLLGLKKTQTEDKDIVAAAKAKVVVETNSENEKLVSKAATDAVSLEELRKRASE